uniref:Uncharacterized protein n=1 Tax=Brassica oleracea var. oleracea TaxID=109376 RepID=A0A0D3BC66_BRAOL
MHAYIPGAAVAGRSTKGRMRRARKKKNVTDSLQFIVAFICVKDSNALIPQTGILSIRHSTFESLRVGRSSQSIASNLLAYGIPRTSRKTVSLWESRFSSLMKMCSSIYKIIDHPFLIRFISPTIIDEVITCAPEINLQS